MEVESCQSGKEIKLAFAGSCDDKSKATTEKPGMESKLKLNSQTLTNNFHFIDYRLPHNFLHI